MRVLKIRPRFGERNFQLIENLVEGRFNDAFRNVMSNYAGLSVYENCFVDKDGREWILASFDNFASIYKLTKEFKEHGWGLKVPFAFDPGGWHYCLSFDQNTPGKILVNRWTDHSPEDQFVIIADSFEDFISGLKEQPENNIS